MTISTGTTLNLTHSATDTIDKLFIDGVQQVAGEWGATDSGAAHTSPSITGSGRLNVVTGPPGYASWSIVKGLTEANNAKDFDADNDGMNNLQEYAFDGEPLSGAANKKVFMKPGVGGGTLTIPVRKNAGPFTVVADGLMSPMIDGVIYHIQGSIDLVNWNEGITEAAADTSGPTLSDPTGWEYRTFQIPVGHEKAFLRVKITDTP